MVDQGGEEERNEDAPSSLSSDDEWWKDSLLKGDAAVELPDDASEGHSRASNEAFTDKHIFTIETDGMSAMYMEGCLRGFRRAYENVCDGKPLTSEYDKRCMRVVHNFLFVLGAADSNLMDDICEFIPIKESAFESLAEARKIDRYVQQQEQTKRGEEKKKVCSVGWVAESGEEDDEEDEEVGGGGGGGTKGCTGLQWENDCSSSSQSQEGEGGR